MVRSFSLPFLGSAGRGHSARVSVISLLVTILLSELMAFVTPEIIDLGMDMIIDASSDEVHFIRGFLRAPASIDLSNMRWITNEAMVFEFGEDDFGIDDTLAGDFNDDTLYETSQPTFADPQTEIPILEPIGNEDFADIEGNKDEDDTGGDVTEKANIDEEDSTIPSDSTIASEDKENESGNDVNVEKEVAPEPPIPSMESGAENQEEVSLGETAEEVTKEAEENDGDNDADESQNPIDVNNQETDVLGDGGELVAEDEENENLNQNSEEAAPDTTSKEENESAGEEEESEINGGENNGDVSDEDNINGSDEAEGDIGNNGTEDEEGEEPAQDTSSEDQNQMVDNGDGQTETEQENNTGEGPSLDDRNSEDDSDGSDESGGDIGNNGNEEEPAQDTSTEDESQMGEEGGEAETEEEDSDGNETPPNTSPVANETDENEDVDEEVGGNGDEDDQSGDASINETEESPPNPSTETGGDRTLQDNNDDISNNTNQVVNIALFLIPENCEKDSWGNCDWVTLGVGSYDDEMQQGMSYCCSKDAASRGVCESNDIGTLMIDKKKFDGFQRKIQVPSTALEEFEIDDPVFDVNTSGDYILVIANCNDDGFGIITLGNMEWKSVGGYLPGEIFYEMFVYGAATAIFLVLGLWYYCGMRMFQEAAIPIQKFILASIILGFLGTAFLAIDLLV